MVDNDPVIGGFLFGIETLFRQVHWEIEDHPDASSRDERTDFLEECRNDMSLPWPDTLSEILTFIPWGWALNEINYKRRAKGSSNYPDGRIGWDGWPLRAQESLLHWEFDEYGGIVSMVQLGPPDFIPHTIPMEKSLLFRTTAKLGNPEGRPLVRNAYRPWYFLKHMQAIEGIGAERDVAGIPTFWVPGELMELDTNGNENPQLAAYKKLGANIRVDEEACIVMPLVYNEQGNKMYEFCLTSTAGQKQFDLDQIITRYEKRILMSVLFDVLMLGQDSVGTQSLGETKAKLLTTALDSFLDMICAQVNDQAIPRLLKLNGMSTDMMPRLKHGRIDKPDLTVLSSFLAQIGESKTGAGIQLDTRVDGDLAKRLMDEAGLPPPPDAADLPPDPQAGPQTPGAPPMPGAPVQMPNAGPTPPNPQLPSTRKAQVAQPDDDEDEEDTLGPPKRASESDGREVGDLPSVFDGIMAGLESRHGDQ